MTPPEPTSSTDSAPTRRIGQFAPTRWTLVRRACDASPASESALAELCEAYYEPVLAFIRRSGRNPDDARDLAQGFFGKLLAAHRLNPVVPGSARFRSYLLGMVRHFLWEEWDRARAAKRGGGQAPVSLDRPATEIATSLQLADPQAQVSDAVFDRLWAVTLVDRAAGLLAAEAARDGREHQFRVLKPWLVGAVPELSQAEAAVELGVTEGAVKVAVHRLRRRFRELVRAEIAQTVEEPDQVAGELQYLVEVLSHPSGVPD